MDDTLVLDANGVRKAQADIAVSYGLPRTALLSP